MSIGFVEDSANLLDELSSKIKYPSSKEVESGGLQSKNIPDLAEEALRESRKWERIHKAADEVATWPDWKKGYKPAHIDTTSPVVLTAEDQVNREWPPKGMCAVAYPHDMGEPLLCQRAIGHTKTHWAKGEHAEYSWPIRESKPAAQPNELAAAQASFDAAWTAYRMRTKDIEWIHRSLIFAAGWNAQQVKIEALEQQIENFHLTFRACEREAKNKETKISELEQQITELEGEIKRLRAMYIDLATD